MPHPLESNTTARSCFEAAHNPAYIAGWRAAIETVFSNLPSWAQRKHGGQVASFNASEAVARYMTGGISLRALAHEYGVRPQTLGYHARKQTQTI